MEEVALKLVFNEWVGARPVEKSRRTGCWLKSQSGATLDRNKNREADFAYTREPPLLKVFPSLGKKETRAQTKPGFSR